MRLINCKEYAQTILDKVKADPRKRALMIVSMGDNPASNAYVKGKLKDCEYCGIPSIHKRVETERELAEAIYEGDMNDAVAGIIVQLPLPEDIDEDLYTDLVVTSKDVDGFKMGSYYTPCTPEGIMYVLRHEFEDLRGKRVLVIGRGKLVGIPMVGELLDADCTVTIAHSKTTNLDVLLKENDIIISAVGKPKLVDLKKCNAEVVIDVGINRDENGKLCGDCYNFEDTGEGMRVTSVPGGIGLMTRAILMEHVARASK